MGSAAGSPGTAQLCRGSLHPASGAACPRTLPSSQGSPGAPCHVAPPAAQTPAFSRVGGRASNASSAASWEVRSQPSGVPWEPCQRTRPSRPLGRAHQAREPVSGVNSAPPPPAPYSARGPGQRQPRPVPGPGVPAVRSPSSGRRAVGHPTRPTAGPTGPLRVTQNVPVPPAQAGWPQRATAAGGPLGRPRCRRSVQQPPGCRREVFVDETDI